MTAPERIDSIVDVELDQLAIGHLDFDPQCQSLDELVLVIAGTIHVPMGQRRCGTPSAFVATCLGCKHRSFQCTAHHDAMLVLNAECGRCGALGLGSEMFAFSPLSGGGS